MTKKLFNNNKIKEAICQFTFTNSIIDGEFIKALKEKLASKYSKQQDAIQLHFNFSPTKPTAEKFETSGCKLSNDDNSKIVQVFSSNISIHQVGQYKDWDVFKEDIKEILNILKTLKKLDVLRIDLRAINLFEFETNFDVNKFFKVVIKYPGDTSSQSNFQFTIEKNYEVGKSAGVIRGNCVQDNNNSKFVLDLSHINLFINETMTTHEFDKIVNVLDEGNARLYDLFTHSITPETENIIK